MAPALLTCLPTMQLVCSCLVITGNSGTDGIVAEKLSETPHLIASRNLSFVTMAPVATDLPFSTSARALPSGYVAHPELGLAYKVHSENVNWYVALGRCAQDGAHLAIIDTFEKVKLVKQQRPAEHEYVHVGFHLGDGDSSTWYNAYTGLPVSDLPWGRSEPSGNQGCAKIDSSGTGLGRYSCTVPGVFVCQIPYPSDKLIVNASN